MPSESVICRTKIVTLSRFSVLFSLPTRSSAIADIILFRLICITHNTHTYIYIHIVTLVVRGWLKTRYDPLGNGPAIGSAVDLGIRAHAAQLIAPTMDDRHNIIIFLLLNIVVSSFVQHHYESQCWWSQTCRKNSRNHFRSRTVFPYIVLLQVQNGFLR